MASTTTNRSGTCRGDSSERSALRSPGSTSSSDAPSASTRKHSSAPSSLRAQLGGVDHQRVGDLVEALDHRVEVGGAHPDAAAVERGVAAPVDDVGAARGDAHPVAVPPHAREVLEVGLAQPGAVRVVPEHHRHRRHRVGDHQLADLVDELACPPRRRRRTPRAERRAGDLAQPHRHGRRRRRRTPVHTSVPPDIEQIWMCSPTASPIQRKPSTDSGAPVEPIDADAGQVVLVAAAAARP